MVVKVQTYSAPRRRPPGTAPTGRGCRYRPWPARRRCRCRGRPPGRPAFLVEMAGDQLAGGRVEHEVASVLLAPPPARAEPAVGGDVEGAHAPRCRCRSRRRSIGRHRSVGGWRQAARPGAHLGARHGPRTDVDPEQAERGGRAARGRGASRSSPRSRHRCRGTTRPRAPVRSPSRRSGRPSSDTAPGTGGRA